ncbi:hypothetical protein IEG05_14090 [Pseudomonas kunmingensis]|uniref:DUF6511 domain-containing protein n=1 Tax=Stutzerimonas kunmingensis TaxID=1211807 RepID=UPI0017460951|nr:DUF6511 domain-containing protein [Stutzerimonas kunmingensis]MBD3876349.1 hypothetical protein [Stutzerimonas kunmingensis]
MAGQCWVCKRQARGIKHSDNRFKAGEPRRYPMEWVFCSRRCQDAFHALYGCWLKTGPRQGDVLMVDPTEFERSAMRACLKFFGEAAGEIGFDKPLGQYSEAEALRVIEAIVAGWTEAMAAHHQQAKYPPVRGIAPYETQAPQPVATLEPAPATSAFDPANPFADLEDDLPWETVESAPAKPGKRRRAK